jgi:hypothetical protein
MVFRVRVAGVRNQCRRRSLHKARNRSSTHLFNFLHSSPLTIWSPLEQLIPYADIVFLNRHYAQAQSPSYTCAPPACLLALTRLTPPYALLVAVLGCRWRRSALRPDMRVPPVLWVVHTAHSHSRRAPLEVSRFTRLTCQSACVRLNLRSIRSRRPCSLLMR